MNKKLERFADYMVTPFERLGWIHSIFWGMTLGFSLGVLSSLVIYISWMEK